MSRAYKQEQHHKQHHKEEGWTHPIIEAYRQSAEDHVWLKPATWIALIGLLASLFGGTYMWGKSSSQKVTQEQLKQAIQGLSTRNEVQKDVANKANREDVIKLEGKVDLIKQDIRYIKTRQREGFDRINKRLDLLLRMNQRKGKPGDE